MERTILHCDLNSFYASVELLHNPQWRGKALAVCGSVEERHGIVLAKTELAKRHGVQTGEAIWQAQQKCPDLIITPPRFEEYLYYSERARRIYMDYTDLIEPFGIDECWLDVTASRLLFGDGVQIAQTLRRRMREELGLTISVGVSFNKIFAKLGSDYKKPDAVTEIPHEGFMELIGGLPCTDMLGVGSAMGKQLRYYGISTLSELAGTDVEFLSGRFGKCGRQIWEYANGMDISPVRHMNDSEPVKSVGKGTTCITDLYTQDEVWQVIYTLSQDVAKRLRVHSMLAGSVQLCVKDNLLQTKQYQRPLAQPTQCFSEIAQAAMALFRGNYNWERGVRALTVRAINLRPEAEQEAVQLTLDGGHEKQLKRERIELAIEHIRERYGFSAINAASLFAAPNIAAEPLPNTMPRGIIKSGAV